MRNKAVKYILNRAIVLNHEEKIYLGYNRKAEGVFSIDELELIINNDVDKIMADNSDKFYSLEEIQQKKLILSHFGL